ncbi:MAG TPA: alpha/beta hydrolase [Anaerolineales bacterium]|nr:alpha/beta hydrolase [Anaerolineales bacterium]
MTTENVVIPATANFIQQGEGLPVVMIHGIAASLHDWDALIPELVNAGYACYALDLLGHGDSPKPASPAYHVEWLFDHFVQWMTSLRLTEPAILIGHSLGGYLALEYARRFSARTRGLILVNPLYSPSQLHFLFRRSFSRRNLKGAFVSKIPVPILRAMVDLTSLIMGRDMQMFHALPEHVRAQTVLDYKRTAPGVYHIPSTVTDLTEHLPSISVPTLVVWGDRDQTLAPSSFPKLVGAMTRAISKPLRAGHVPHQSHSKEFNRIVLAFLENLSNSLLSPNQ